jgi:hypothetical protein
MMLRAVSWLKDALTTKGVVPALSHFMLEPGRMAATDGNVCAVHPVDYGGPAALLPGAPLQKVLVSVGPDRAMTLTWPTSATQAVLKAGKLRCTFATMPRDAWPYDYDALLQTLTWHPWTEELMTALRAVEPFIGANAARVWSTCVGFQRGYLIATTNVAIGRYKVQHPAVADMDVLLPRWAFDFITSHHEHLTEWAVADHAWFFRWDNGAWVRCAGVIGEFPAASEIVDKHLPDPESSFEVTPEFRDTYHQLTELTPENEHIKIGHDTMEGGEEGAHVVLDVGIGSVTEFTSSWTPKFLTPVVARAKYIDLTAFPKPAGFISEDGLLTGVVLGRHA